MAGFTVWCYKKGGAPYTPFRRWVQDHRLTVACMCLLSFSNGSVFTLIHSGFLGFRRFSAPLPIPAVEKVELLGLSTVLLEDIPQLVVTVFVSWNTDTWDGVAYASIAFSCLSVLVSILMRLWSLMLLRDKDWNNPEALNPELAKAHAAYEKASLADYVYILNDRTVVVDEPAPMHTGADDDGIELMPSSGAAAAADGQAPTAGNREVRVFLLKTGAELSLKAGGADLMGGGRHKANRNSRFLGGGGDDDERVLPAAFLADPDQPDVMPTIFLDDNGVPVLASQLGLPVAIPLGLSVPRENPLNVPYDADLVEKLVDIRSQFTRGEVGTRLVDLQELHRATGDIDNMNDIYALTARAANRTTAAQAARMAAAAADRSSKRKSWFGMFGRNGSDRRMIPGALHHPSVQEMTAEEHAEEARHLAEAVHRSFHHRPSKEPLPVPAPAGMTVSGVTGGSAAADGTQPSGGRQYRVESIAELAAAEIGEGMSSPSGSMAEGAGTGLRTPVSARSRASPPPSASSLASGTARRTVRAPTLQALTIASPTGHQQIVLIATTDSASSPHAGGFGPDGASSVTTVGSGTAAAPVPLNTSGLRTISSAVSLNSLLLAAASSTSATAPDGKLARYPSGNQPSASDSPGTQRSSEGGASQGRQNRPSFAASWKAIRTRAETLNPFGRAPAPAPPLPAPAAGSTVPGTATDANLTRVSMADMDDALLRDIDSALDAYQKHTESSTGSGSRSRAPTAIIVVPTSLVHSLAPGKVVGTSQDESPTSSAPSQVSADIAEESQVKLGPLGSLFANAPARKAGRTQTASGLTLLQDSEQPESSTGSGLNKTMNVVYPVASNTAMVPTSPSPKVQTTINPVALLAPSNLRKGVLSSGGGDKPAGTIATMKPTTVQTIRASLALRTSGNDTRPDGDSAQAVDGTGVDQSGRSSGQLEASPRSTVESSPLDEADALSTVAGGTHTSHADEIRRKRSILPAVWNPFRHHGAESSGEDANGSNIVLPAVSSTPTAPSSSANAPSEPIQSNETEKQSRSQPKRSKGKNRK
jgi:hypothetical protein